MDENPYKSPEASLEPPPVARAPGAIWQDLAIGIFSIAIVLTFILVTEWLANLLALATRSFAPDVA